jgi:hypothetical protein
MEEPKDDLKTSEVPAEAATEAQTDVQVFFFKKVFFGQFGQDEGPNCLPA